MDATEARAARLPDPCPAPADAPNGDGVFPDIPNETYHRWDALNASTLNECVVSLRQCRNWLDAPSTTTTALRFGSAFHAYILEPDVFEKDYKVVAKVADSPIAKTWAKLDAEHGQAVIGDVHVKKFEQMKEAMKSNRAASAVLERIEASRSELTVVWDDKETSLRCKARIDLWAEGDNGDAVLVDLKTCRSAHPARFSYDADEYGYHRQFAWYRMGAAQTLGEMARVKIVACEKEPPFHVTVFDVSDEMLMMGAQHNRELKLEYARALVRAQQLRNAGENPLEAWFGYAGEEGKADLMPSPRLLSQFADASEGGKRSRR